MKLSHKPSKRRILQISNDISEDMCEASNLELIATVKFWQQEQQRWVNAFNSVALEVCGVFIESQKKVDKIRKRACK
jgi:hypothetical protein